MDYSDASTIVFGSPWQENSFAWSWKIQAQCGRTAFFIDTRWDFREDISCLWGWNKCTTDRLVFLPNIQLFVRERERIQCFQRSLYVCSVFSLAIRIRLLFWCSYNQSESHRWHSASERCRENPIMEKYKKCCSCTHTVGSPNPVTC